MTFSNAFRLSDSHDLDAFGRLRRSLTDKEAALGKAFANLKRHAKKRNLSVAISNCFFMEMSAHSCIYCGIPPSNTARSRKKAWAYNGIDRLDNSRGYEPNNCVPCCKRCNWGKGVMSFDEFRQWIATVHTRFEKGDVRRAV